MIDQSTTVRPGDFCRYLLKTLEAAEGQTRRRKRDQTPDRIGLGVRRQLLEQAIADDPPPERFEIWLVQQVLAAASGGPVRAMASQILDEYRLTSLSPEFAAWLAAGAPSADADDPARVKTDAEVGGAAARHDPQLDGQDCPICRSITALRDV